MTSALLHAPGRAAAGRRWIAAVSAVGAANMALGTLRQTGVIRHLPDPRFGNFDSDAVLTSRQAFALGVPDAPVAMLGLLANIPLAFAGGVRRDLVRPWLPVAIAAKSIVEVSVAAWYLAQMRTRLHTWCAYCLLGSTVNTIVAALAVREANAVLRRRGTRLSGALAGLCLAALAFGTMSIIDARRRAHERRHAPLGA